MLWRVATVRLWRRKEKRSKPSWDTAAGNSTVWSQWSRFPLYTGYTAQSGPLLDEQINCTKNPAEAGNVFFSCVMDVHSLQIRELITVALFCNIFISLHSVLEMLSTNTETN